MCFVYVRLQLNCNWCLIWIQFDIHYVWLVAVHNFISDIVITVNCQTHLSDSAKCCRPVSCNDDMTLVSEWMEYFDTGS